MTCLLHKTSSVILAVFYVATILQLNLGYVAHSYIPNNKQQKRRVVSATAVAVVSLRRLFFRMCCKAFFIEKIISYRD